MDTVDKVNNLSKSDFISIFGNVFEKTAWIAEKAYSLKPFLDFNTLKKIFLSTYDECSNEQYLKIFNSHPQLAIEKIMTKHSKKEQSKSKLDSCTKEELEEFTKLNHDYKKKFNFLYYCCCGFEQKTNFSSFRDRIKKNIDEFEEAKNQVKKIAIIRLNHIIDN